MHERLLALDGELDETVLGAISTDLGLDPAAVIERMGSDEVTAILTENRALAQRLQINGTPSFVLGGPENAEMIRGFLPAAELRGVAASLRD